MSDSTNPAADADADLELRSERRRRRSFILVAPGPDLPDARDRAGAQRGMALLLIGGGLFWTAVAAVAVYLLRR